uniref:NADPH-dependent diflavin oxidoreductase 1 n=1 Tax=Haptolina ericina TaxID=156174 RepID=A0A7S3BRL8_9EUKA|mmetsp:Transcript_66404/g.148261  ORF Transcript_66404/g.148261 Transcript_66404/m.148261 type:complete len:611 (+) Transcript_66404:18-1850(+)
MSDRRILVLFGSQTGCAEEVALQIVQDAARRGLEVRCMAMEDYELTHLPSERCVVCVASTTGEGEVPDNMRSFWRFLLRKDLPPGSLSNLMHACFGLGDSSYPKFNYAAKRLHRRLEHLGSTALLPLGLGDDMDSLGVDQALSPWLVSLWAKVDILMPLPSPEALVPENECPASRYTVTEVYEGAMPPADISLRPPHERTSRSSLVPNRERPFAAHVLANVRITARQSTRDVRHIVLGVAGSGLRYAPGDAVAVQPRNPEQRTMSVLAQLGLRPAAWILIKPAVAHAPSFPVASCTIQELFTQHLDLFGVPRRSFFRMLAHFATLPAQRERLQEFGDVKGAEDLLDYCTRPRRTFAEVLAEFSSARPPLEYYLDLIPKLRQRYFSIASSPLLHPDQIHVCVAVVRYQTHLKEPRFGVCSTFLADLPANAAHDASASSEVRVPVWIRRGCLTMPSDPEAQMLMVGLGTGVAPFRSFVQTRQCMQPSAGCSPGHTVLYFGCRHKQEDFLYSNEWEVHLHDKDLQELHVAFSRDQERKVYVQHLMEVQRAKLWDTLSKPNSYIFIAGPSNQAPKAIRRVLKEVAITEGQLTAEHADILLKRLEAEHRFQCETW